MHKQRIVRRTRETNMTVFCIADSVRARKSTAVVKRTKKNKKDAACPAHKGDILAVAISPDEKYVVTGGHDTLIKV